MAVENRAGGDYLPAMSSHSLAEAQADLPALVERALRGEPVVITRDGAPVVEMRACGTQAAEPGPEPLSPDATVEEEVAWLDRHRVGRLVPGAPDAAALVRQMRDEG